MAPTLEQTLVGLLPILIGGLLAALGGILGAFIHHRLNISREIRANERAKLERVATLAFDYSAWVDRRLSAMLFQRIDFREHSPTDELRMLVNLYFPSLLPEMAAVLQAGLDCQKWVNATWTEQRKNLKVWIDAPDNMKTYYPLAEVLISKTGVFIEAVRKALPK